MKKEDLTLLVDALLSSIEALSLAVSASHPEFLIREKRGKVFEQLETLRKELYFRNTYELPKDWKRRE